MTVTDEGVLGQVPGGKVWGLDEAKHCRYNRMWLYSYSVWMLCSELKVPLARLWILLSYSDSSAKFSRSLKSDALMQWILLAFSNLEDNNSVTRCAGAHQRDNKDVLQTHRSSREVRPSNTPAGSSVILLPYRTLQQNSWNYVQSSCFRRHVATEAPNVSATSDTGNNI